MTRVLGVLIHNWPLKLAAIGLATLLYGGLVLSQSSATLTGVVPVTPREQPDDTFLLTTLRPVTEIRYFTPSDVRPISSDFEAWVDLSDVAPGSGRRSVPIQLRSIDPRVRVLDFEPQNVTIELDQVAQKTVSVQVERGEIPVNMSVGPVTVDPPEVRVVGPASVLTRVVSAQATVVVQPSGIDVDQDVELVPIDDVGDAVGQVRLEPATARVTIPIFSDRETRQLPVRPLITGSPPAGFDLVAPTVEPRFITVEGDADELAALTFVDTQPIPVTGFSTSRTLEVGLALPNGVVALEVQEVTVTIGVRAVTGTRTFEVGMRLIGVQPDLSYKVAVDRVLITVGGSTPDLDRLIGATLAVDLDVTTLGPGTTDVTVSAALPPGLSLVSASPPRVQVAVTARPTPPPS